jgi:perosamine synthetase
LWALQAEGVAASLWQLLPLPAQPVFRRRRFAPWRPGDDEPLEPWDREAFRETGRLLESSIVLGTAAAPFFHQPAELMERYLDAFEKVLSDRDTLFTALYRQVQPWPPLPAGDL